MSVNYTDFLESAKALEAGASEIDIRNAISRSYYSAYHRAYPISILLANGKPDIAGGSHKQLIQRFKDVENSSPLRRSAAGIAYTLEILRNERCNADYLIDNNFSTAQFESHMRYIQRVMDQLTSFSNLMDTVKAEATG
jgi:uncharacterized protein (UPF0332 family)